jgi:hypothetical protein
MANYIGPLTITAAQLWDGNVFSASSGGNKSVSAGATIFIKGSFESNESFTIIVTNDQALQIKGLVEIGEPVWIDTADTLTDNDFLQHKGWYLLTNVDFELLNTNKVQCTIECELISTNLNEYLTLDYTKGNIDGTSLDITYEPANTVYDLQDDGSTYDNWQTVREYPSTATTSAASDGAEIDIACASAVDGTAAVAFSRSNIKYYAPFTLETVLDVNAFPAGGAYNASMGIALSPDDLPETLDGGLRRNENPALCLDWVVDNSTSYLQVATSKGNGQWINEYPPTSQGVAQVTMGIKMTIDENYNLKVETDLGLTASWTTIYEGVTNLMNQQNGMYVYLYVFNKDTTSFTGSYHFVNIYNTSNVNTDMSSYKNIVVMPYGATVQTAATGNRVGEDGNYAYYDTPSVPLRFQTTQANMYKGSVKLLTTNNNGSDSFQVYHTDARLTPATTTLKNGFTQITFDADEMIISGYHGGAWTEVTRLDYGAGSAITIIKPLLITHDEVILQVNDTKIHMTRSSPMITLYHPNTSLTYPLQDRYYHNGGLTSAPGAAADIAMTDLDDGYYAYIYTNATDVNRVVIGKKDPTTIKSDSLPADDVTGIGWTTAALEGAGSIDTAKQLVEQWWKQTRTRFAWKQIV